VTSLEILETVLVSEVFIVGFKDFFVFFIPGITDTLEENLPKGRAIYIQLQIRKKVTKADKP
jgi:hypothetical protein